MKRVECSEVLEQLSDYLDADARDELCRAIEDHLSRCSDCKIEVDTVRKTIVLYQNASQVELPVRVSAQLQSALAREYTRPSNDPPSD